MSSKVIWIVLCCKIVSLTYLDNIFQTLSGERVFLLIRGELAGLIKIVIWKFPLRHMFLFETCCNSNQDEQAIKIELEKILKEQVNMSFNLKFFLIKCFDKTCRL